MLAGRVVEVDVVSYSDVDDSQEALVLLLELSLVEHLYDQDRVFGHVEVKGLVPVRGGRPLDGFGGLRL